MGPFSFPQRTTRNTCLPRCALACSYSTRDIICAARAPLLFFAPLASPLLSPCTSLPHPHPSPLTLLALRPPPPAPLLPRSSPSSPALLAPAQPTHPHPHSITNPSRGPSWRGGGSGAGSGYGRGGGATGGAGGTPYVPGSGAGARRMSNSGAAPMRKDDKGKGAYDADGAQAICVAERGASACHVGRLLPLRMMRSAGLGLQHLPPSPLNSPSPSARPTARLALRSRAH